MTLFLFLVFLLNTEASISRPGCGSLISHTFPLEPFHHNYVFECWINDEITNCDRFEVEIDTSGNKNSSSMLPQTFTFIGSCGTSSNVYVGTESYITDFACEEGFSTRFTLAVNGIPFLMEEQCWEVVRNQNSTTLLTSDRCSEYWTCDLYLSLDQVSSSISRFGLPHRTSLMLFLILMIVMIRTTLG